MRPRIPVLVSLLLLALSVAAREPVTPLREGWRIQAAAKVQATGAELSLPGASTEGWTPAQVPTTVLGALVKAGVYGDPFPGRNLEKITPEPFKGAWWYRTEFRAPQGAASTRLVFEGISYRADIWLNGKRIAGKDTTFGVWRVVDLDVTGELRQGLNALAVEVHPPTDLDFAQGFCDWTPAPADRNMGLYRPVSLRTSGPVSLEAPFVQAKVELKTLDQADLTLSVDLVNHTGAPWEGRLEGAFEGVTFQVPCRLAPQERRTLRLGPGEVAGLRVRHPRLWWPVNLGSPELYHLRLKLRAGGAPSDERQIPFGIREVGDYLTPQGDRGYTVNGRKLLIRGGGWTDDIFLREDPANVEAQLQYVRHMNLNTVRMEGFWGVSQVIYDLADRMGILIMPGFSCAWEWDHYKGHPKDEDEFGGAKLPGDIDLLATYLQDQVRALRNHPSIFVWVIGSDKLPWPEAETRYRGELAVLDPGRPILSSCKRLTSPVSGTSGVKMAGPYNYVTPNFWFLDRAYGGAYGFNTETGPGPEVPPLASLTRMLGPGPLWPMNDVWKAHCALGSYSNLDLFLAAFNQRYGEARDLEDFAFRAQASNFEALRAMYEAFGAAKPAATGIVQWMLNSAFPKMYWQLYDYYLLPGGAFFGARKGSEPLHVLYDVGHHDVHVVNDTRADLNGATVRVTLLDQASKVVLERRLRISCPALAAARIQDLPPLPEGKDVHFLDLRLTDARGRELSRNFYWLSSRKDAWDLATYTESSAPCTQYADFTGLNRLAPARVTATCRAASGGWEVTLANPTDRVAFFLEMQLLDAQGTPVVPVLWDDNYVSLLPGETRTIRVRRTVPGPGRLEVAVKGWNIPALRCPAS
jgi:exo-1,4-beta-D-glucosaminidase